MKTIEEVENLIEQAINEIKPEIRKRFVYQITDQIVTIPNPTFEKEGKQQRVLADVNLDLYPPMIRFFSKSISMLEDEDLYGRIKRLISHEFAHILGSNEKEAIQKQKMNIFK